MRLGEWDSLPLDLLSRILSLLPLASQASATSVCSHWRRAAAPAAADHNVPGEACRRPPWFLTMPARPHPAVPYLCYARDPEQSRWHTLSLDFLPRSSHPLRLLAPAGPLLICRVPGPTFRLALCNPFTRQLLQLPDLKVPRSNPALGVVVLDGTNPGAASSSSTATVDAAHASCVRLYVAGGTSAAMASYEPTFEAYDHDLAGGTPARGRWEAAGAMPPEFAVRLTVWTAGEGVHAVGGVYWVTSARAYSVVRFDTEAGRWSEIRAPMAERLEWASLVEMKGRRLGLVGGIVGEEEQGRQGHVWEMVGDGDWRPVAVVPVVEEWRKAGRSGGGSSGGGSFRCVGAEGVVYLFRDLCSGMLVWREAAATPAATTAVSGDDDKDNDAKRYGRWKWDWVDGWKPRSRSASPGGTGTTSSGGIGTGVAIRAALLHPSLSPSHIT